MSTAHWKTAHTIVLLVVTGSILGLGAISTYVTFDEAWNWGVWSFIILAALLTALLCVIGHGLTKRVDGALMDERFRISLSQFQVAVWTVVVLAAWGAAVFANLGLNQSGTAAFDVSIPSELWLALGISLASLGGAKLIQASDVRTPPAPIDESSTGGTILAHRIGQSSGQPLAGWTTRGNLLAHASPGRATWGDLFAADTASAGGVPDISKIQMFFFTVVLAFGYAVACADLFGTHGTTPITGLPTLNESFVILLGISQGAYLTKKSVDVKMNP